MWTSTILLSIFLNVNSLIKVCILCASMENHAVKYDCLSQTSALNQNKSPQKKQLEIPNPLLCQNKVSQMKKIRKLETTNLLPDIGFIYFSQCVWLCLWLLMCVYWLSLNISRKKLQKIQMKKTNQNSNSFILSHSTSKCLNLSSDFIFSDALRAFHKDEDLNRRAANIFIFMGSSWFITKDKIQGQGMNTKFMLINIFKKFLMSAEETYDLKFNEKTKGRITRSHLFICPCSRSRRCNIDSHVCAILYTPSTIYGKKLTYNYLYFNCNNGLWELIFVKLCLYTIKDLHCHNTLCTLHFCSKNRLDKYMYILYIFYLKILCFISYCQKCNLFISKTVGLNSYVRNRKNNSIYVKYLPTFKIYFSHKNCLFNKILFKKKCLL